MRRLAVYCAANPGRDPAFVATARVLGAAMAARRVGLVYGGGRVGLMGVVADAVLAGGGEVTGVITDHLIGAEIAHPGLTRLDVVATMHQRKARMAELVEGAIVLPGGLGTLDETFELLTWNQLRLVAMPVVALDVDGYFDHLVRFLDHATERRLIRPAHRALFQRTAAVEDALGRALAPPPVVDVAKWVDAAGRPLSASDAG